MQNLASTYLSTYDALPCARKRQEENQTHRSGHDKVGNLDDARWVDSRRLNFERCLLPAAHGAGRAWCGDESGLNHHSIFNPRRLLNDESSQDAH